MRTGIGINGSPEAGRRGGLEDAGSRSGEGSSGGRRVHGSYLDEHRDVILAVLTGNVELATTSSDYVLEDWKDAGLNTPTAFRAFLSTQWQRDVLKRIGQLSKRDWKEVRERLRRALAVQDAEA
jgi:hypothetical protein